MQDQNKIKRITIDFETRSKANLLAVGTWNYSKHPSTEVMCLSWRYGDESGFWHMRHGRMIGQLGEKLAKAKKRKGAELLVKQLKQDIKDLDETPLPTKLFELINQGIPVEAHNAFFELCIWKHVCVPKLDWPEIRDDQWMCSAAKASMHALPRDLERATGEICPKDKKDSDGKAVMLKLCKPARPIKSDPDRIWYEDPEDLRVLWSYCEQDTWSEHKLSENLDDLPPKEFALWQMDQRMNLRGFYCDHALAKKAIALNNQVSAYLQDQLSEITDGTITKATQRAKVKAWINQELALLGKDPVDGTGAPVLERLMQDPNLPGTNVHAVVNLVRAATRTSIKKYQAMLDRSDEFDHRIRDMMMYHGANTGRWSGKGVQPHNFPRGFIKDMEETCDDLIEYGLGELLVMYDGEQNLMDILSWALRGALCAPDGRVLYVADYAAIEARVLIWLADDQPALQVFRDGKDIYKDMAMTIYKIGYDEVGGEERRMGKQAILGLGYQMGGPKFWDTIAGYEPQYKGVDRFGRDVDFLMKPGTDILDLLRRRYRRDEALAECFKYGFALSKRQEDRVVNDSLANDTRDWTDNITYFLFVRNVVIQYRERYSAVKKLWYELNAAAVEAVKNPGERFPCSKVTWYMNDNDFLCCELPSGRNLYYRSPEIKLNAFKQEAVSYMTVNAVTKQWWRTDTYGGKLVENISQAIARDLMGDAMLRIDQGDTYDLLASVHDELICEADEGTGNVEEFEKLMAAVEPWAEGCPVAAEGWVGKRYRK